jgi:hypothetical protein
MNARFTHHRIFCVNRYRMGLCLKNNMAVDVCGYDTDPVDLPEEHDENSHCVLLGCYLPH